MFQYLKFVQLILSLAVFVTATKAQQETWVIHSEFDGRVLFLYFETSSHIHCCVLQVITVTENLESGGPYPVYNTMAAADQGMAQQRWKNVRFPG
jgi:hypothetical protein